MLQVPFPDANQPATNATVSEHSILRAGPGTAYDQVSELGADQQVIAGFDMDSDPFEEAHPTWRPVEVHLFEGQDPLLGYVASELLF